MSAKIETTQIRSNSSKIDLILWGLVVVLIAGGIAANYYFGAVAWAIRFAIGIVVAIAVIFIALRTATGKKVLAFAKESRIELYKVVWPTRKETIHTTLIIAGLVVVMAFILWGIDSLLLWIINSIIA